MAKANSLAKAMKLDEFKSSHGWFTKFLKRHGYKSFKLHGESNAADAAAVDKAREAVPKIIEGEVTVPCHCQDLLQNLQHKICKLQVAEQQDLP